MSDEFLTETGTLTVEEARRLIGIMREKCSISVPVNALPVEPNQWYRTRWINGELVVEMIENVMLDGPATIIIGTATDPEKFSR
jgi:hypothetical protein